MVFADHLERIAIKVAKGLAQACVQVESEDLLLEVVDSLLEFNIVFSLSSG